MVTVSGPPVPVDRAGCRQRSPKTSTELSVRSPCSGRQGRDEGVGERAVDRERVAAEPPKTVRLLVSSLT